jgi:hypothetical protein
MVERHVRGSTYPGWRAVGRPIYDSPLKRMMCGDQPGESIDARLRRAGRDLETQAS